MNLQSPPPPKKKKKREERMKLLLVSWKCLLWSVMWCDEYNCCLAEKNYFLGICVEWPTFPRKRNSSSKGSLIHIYVWTSSTRRNNENIHPQEERVTSITQTTNLQQSADSPGRNPPPALSRRRGQAVAVGMKCQPFAASVLSGHRITTAPATIANEPVQWHES